jgi:hypothetical protein
MTGVYTLGQFCILRFVLPSRVVGHLQQRYERNDQMSLPEERTIVHTLMLDKSTEAEFARALGHALRVELHVMGAPAKVIGKWTGASNRAIRNWLAGKAVPSGFHLVRLMRYSDLAMMTVMAAARRDYHTEEAQ